MLHHAFKTASLQRGVVGDAPPALADAWASVGWTSPDGSQVTWLSVQ
jgi:hypothetical protein